MPKLTRPPLESFTDLIRATDPHATHRLALLAEASQRLLAPRSGAAEDRKVLAGRLERWRYQLLNERAGNLRPEDRKLSDALDVTANELAGRPSRPPRAARDALAGERDDRRIAEAKACLQPDFPLDDLAARAVRLTAEHFGGCNRARAPSGSWQILLYAPLYLSSHCVNYCTYCGFRYPNAIEREHLDVPAAVHQAEILYRRGFRHMLLVAGDFPGLMTSTYTGQIIRRLTDRAVEVAIEIAPQTTDGYIELADAGASRVALYQETYDERLYHDYHPRGSKASYDWRLEGLERAAEAGMRGLGLGILLGLADPRKDLLAMVRHARYLQERFPGRLLAFSLPRIHDAPQGFATPYPVDDELFVRMYCTLRLIFPEAMLVLSTREPAALRDRLTKLCITQLSAGSTTSPGGYEDGAQCKGEQFPVSDRRSVDEVAQRLRQNGFQVVWRCDDSAAEASTE